MDTSLVRATLMIWCNETLVITSLPKGGQDLLLHSSTRIYSMRCHQWNFTFVKPDTGKLRYTVCCNNLLQTEFKFLGNQTSRSLPQKGGYHSVPARDVSFSSQSALGKRVA